MDLGRIVISGSGEKGKQKHVHPEITLDTGIIGDGCIGMRCGGNSSSDSVNHPNNNPGRTRQRHA